MTIPELPVRTGIAVPDRVVDPARIDVLLHTALGDQRIVGISFEQAVLMVQAQPIISFQDI